MQNKIVNIDVRDNYRIIVISDVHGHGDILNRLIKRCNLSDDDYLVILGDFINKGIDSYDSYKIVRYLSKRDRTIVLQGNHEHYIHDYLSSEEKFLDKYDLLINDNYETIIDGLLKANNFDINSFDNKSDLYKFLAIENKEIFEYLRRLPIMLYFDDYIFVHGGYDDSFCIKNDTIKFLKYNYYNDLSKINEKKIIVGHWPTCNLRLDKMSNDPYYNDEKNIIFIDGGLGVKYSGELNALFVDKNEGITRYSHIQENDFVKRKIIKEYIFKQEDLININFPNHDVQIIEHDDLISICTHKSVNRTFSVFNSLIKEKDGKHMLRTDYVNNFINLNLGDEVEVCQKFDDCALVKFDGEFGWILLEQI